MKVKNCRDANNHVYHTCRLFDGAPGFRLDELPVTDNASLVDIESLQGSQFRTVCFYNISMTDTNNCSALRLFHKADHPQEEYVDRMEGPGSNSTNSGPCKNYVKVYYGPENNQQFQTLCREDLATIDDVFPVTSLFAVYWTNNIRSNEGSFHLRAQCFD